MSSDDCRVGPESRVSGGIYGFCRRAALAVIALAAGSLTGAAAGGFLMIFAGPLGFIFMLASLPVWFVGGLVVGAPVWWAFSQLHRTKPEDAAFAGLIASTLGAVLFACLLQGAWPILIPVPIAGTVAGYTVHKVYYL